MKVRLKTWSGKTVTESVGAAVERELNRAGGHGYGQIEQLEAELSATQQFLVRLCDVVGDALTEDDIFTLFGRYKSEERQFDGFEVVEDDGSMVVEDDDEDSEGT